MLEILKSPRTLIGLEWSNINLPSHIWKSEVLLKEIRISNVRISFFNPLKIFYSKNGKRGCISPRLVKLNEKVVDNEYSNYKKQMDYIHYLKLIITELYKNK